MTRFIGKNINKSGTTSNLTFDVDSSTAVTLLAAQSESDSPFIEIIVTNGGNKALWIRRRPASADNLKDGRRIAPGETRTIIQLGDNYTGEISGIFDSGGFRKVHLEIL